MPALGLDHVDAVLDHARLGGSHRLILVVIARYADQHGEWRIDQPTLQRKSGLSRRRVQQVLEELVAAGELAVVSHRGRGRLCTYRLQVGEIAQPAAHFSEVSAPEPKGKCAAECAFSIEKTAQKCAADCAFPAPLDPPFPPDPQIPLYPPEKQIQETSGLRPLTGPQSAVLRVKLLLEEAAVPLPSPAQIGLWSKTLGGIEPLLDLLRRLIHAGLATKRQPIVYVHRVVMEQAARPDTTGPRKTLSARAGREILWAAGSDEIRWQQALEIIAETEES